MANVRGKINHDCFMVLLLVYSESNGPNAQLCGMAEITDINDDLLQSNYDYSVL